MKPTTYTVTITTTEGGAHVLGHVPLADAVGLEDAWRAGTSLKLVGPNGATLTVPAEDITDITVTREVR